MEKRYYNDSIFWVEVDRIDPNPFQPRKTFDEQKLCELAESIRQYGVLQPLVVTRREEETPEGGIKVTYQLIAGERRLRAAKLAKVFQVPVVIRAAEESDRMKLELAIIENLQREDLNPLDRAKAFSKLASDFGMMHKQIAAKVSRSREYVSNTLRILALNEEMQNALFAGQMSEGHTRPLLMLIDRPEEQQTLFREILDHKITVREAERRAKRIAVDKIRKNPLPPELLSLEKQLTEAFGTRVNIERRDKGGKVMIDFFSSEDLEGLLKRMVQHEQDRAIADAQKFMGVSPAEIPDAPGLDDTQTLDEEVPMQPEELLEETLAAQEAAKKREEEERMDELYSVRNFSL
jgi:ParB family chromosome partitioning protein